MHPYYVYLHDMVPGVEDLRTTLRRGCSWRSMCAAHTAGFNTPAFVVDTMGGGGKRDVHSLEHYDRETGIAVFTSPSVKPGKKFLYFDPLQTLAPAVQERWWQAGPRQEMIERALEAVRL